VTAAHLEATAGQGETDDQGDRRKERRRLV
jgi:hypothetical protein